MTSTLVFMSCVWIAHVFGLVFVSADHGIHSKANSTADLMVDESAAPKPQPLVVNKASVPLVVYLERGFLFNKQVILPGEAVYLWSPRNGPDYLPYGIVALVGDEQAMPSEMDSLLHFAGQAAVPTAFTAAVVVSVFSAGALTGPALALAPLVSGLPAMAGFTIGAVDIAAGTAAAAAAKKAADQLVTEHPKSFMIESGWVAPGTKYFEVSGGPRDGHLDDLKISEISPGQFLSYKIGNVKLCTAMTSQGYVAEIAFTIEDCGDARLEGPWRQIGFHHDRPQYSLANGNEGFVIEYSNKHKAWRVTTTQGWFSNRPSLYESKVNTGSIPTSGWATGTAGLPAPTIHLKKSTTEAVVMV